MAQQDGFVSSELSSNTGSGSVFGSNFNTTNSNFNPLGGQQNQRTNLFGAMSSAQNGQSSNRFGSFGEHTSETPSGFGSVVGVGTERGSTGMFGRASNISVFGGQTSVPSTSETSPIFGRNVGFGSFATTGHGTQTASFTSSTTSQVSGTPGSVSASNPFGSNQPSLLFSSGNQSTSSSSSSLFSGSTSSYVSAPFGTVQPVFAQPAFSQTQALQSRASVSGFGSYSSIPNQGSNLFGSFPSCTHVSSVTTGSAFGTSSSLSSSSTGIRKRDANGAMSDKVLFGKPEISASGQFEHGNLGAQPFSLNQNVFSQSTPSLFGGTVTSLSSAGMTSENKVLIGQKQSDMSSVGTNNSEIRLFSKHQHELRGTEPSTFSGRVFQTRPSLNVSRPPLFHTSTMSGVNKSSESSINTLFGKPLQPAGALFGKPVLPGSTNLFIKDQSSTKDLFGKNQGRMDMDKNKIETGHTESSSHLTQQDITENSKANSPQKSLSKWNRGKVAPLFDRKRRELPLLTDSQGDSKKFRVSKDDEPGMSSPVRGRSSIRMSMENLSTKNSLIVKDIPPHLNRGSVLRKHFSQFGNITRFQSFPAKNAANITFSSHEEALAAKNEGKYLVPEGPPLSIFWRASSKIKSPDDKQEQARKYQNQTKPVPGSVEDELASMAELPDFQEESPAAPLKFHTLPESVSVRKRSPTPPARRRSPTPPPTSQVQDVDVAKGLFKSIHKARANETSDRVAILDSKDKLLRLLRGRQQSDLATAKAFVGTCPDMCPEKERYYREDIRRLSVYEVIPSTLTSLTGLKSKVDHSRAVKEYSRSSADQEEPLPHELRPQPVLVKTMNYLLSEVADQGGEGKWAEWYDFLWNRTRGIRKDITQQQLCDVQVAELLEKCARFHIFCSERLCEEDMMSFDAKINNENLTKCLQTLKELYADLEKKGIFCLNEAEFRGYMVLMNLNEGDILREIQQLRPEIRDSPHISFAVQVYNSLNSNNYVRFFRLIEERATFLSACILHRYFNQIRSKALLIIMKAHGALGKTIVMYPVEEMIRLLCFEDVREVDSFCFHYGLSLKGADVVLDSKAFIEPESSLPQTRSQSLIEIKQENMSIGEIINGSSIPPLQLPTPYSSFDQDGVFIITADIQEALESSKLFRPKVIPSIEEVKVKKEMLQYSNEAVKSIARILIIEVIDVSVQEIAKEVVKEELDQSVGIMMEVEDLVHSSLDESLRQIAQEVYDEQETMLRKKLEEELAAQKQSACSRLCEEIIDDAVLVMTKQLAQEQMSFVNAELHTQRVERCSQQCTDDILSQILDEMTQDVALEVYDVDVVLKRERLEATEKLVKIMRCRRFLQSWRMKYLAQIRVKRAMLDFPSAPSGISLQEQIHKLVPNRPDKRITQKSFYIGERAKLNIASPMNVIQDELHLNVHLSMASARHMLGNLVMWRALDMTQIVNHHLQRAYQTWKDNDLLDPDTASLQWKLVLSLPRGIPSSSSEELTFSKWLRAKLCRSADREKLLKVTPSYEGEVLSLYQMNEAAQKQSAVSAGLCIRCFHGAWTDSEEISIKGKDLLKGTSAVIFILSCTEKLQHPMWKKEKQRLHQILKQKPETPAVPLILVLPRLLNTNRFAIEVLVENLELSYLYERNLISALHIFQPFIGGQEHPLKCFGEWTNLLTNCLRFAASNIPAPPKLRAKPVSDYVEDAIVEFYKTTVYQDLRSRTRKQLLHQSPNTLLSLYNEVVEHSAMVCASDCLIQMSWPAPEFDQSLPAVQLKSSWNTGANLCDLYELISKMRLPYFRYSDMEADDWSTICQDIWSYVAAVTRKDNGSAKISLHQQVAELLSRTKKMFHQFCWLAHKEGPSEPTYINMAWTDLIDACIHYKLVSLRTGLITLRKHEDEDELTQDEEEPEEVTVYYQESELEDWEPPRIWLDALRSTETTEPGQLKATVEKAAAEARDDSDAVSMETSTTNVGAVEATQSSTTVQWTDIVTASFTDNETSSKWTDLKLLLEQEKAATDKYLKTLESCLSPSNISLEIELGTSNSLNRSLLSPIMCDQKTCYKGQTIHPRQLFSSSDWRHRDRHVPDEIIRASQSSPYNPERLSSPVTSRVSRPPVIESMDVECAGATDDQFNLPPTISERLSDLQNMIYSEKEANVLLEMRLKSFLEPA